MNVQFFFRKYNLLSELNHNDRSRISKTKKGKFKVCIKVQGNICSTLVLKLYHGLNNPNVRLGVSSRKGVVALDFAWASDRLQNCLYQVQFALLWGIVGINIKSYLAFGQHLELSAQCLFSGKSSLQFLLYSVVGYQRQGLNQFVNLFTCLKVTNSLLCSALGGLYLFCVCFS